MAVRRSGVQIWRAALPPVARRRKSEHALAARPTSIAPSAAVIHWPYGQEKNKQEKEQEADIVENARETEEIHAHA